MVRSKRFKPIVNLAHNTEREAAKALGDALNRLAQSEQQLNQLYAYREEYHEKFNVSGSQGMTAQQMNEYRHFIEKITDAIDKQKKVIEQARIHLTEKKNFWFAKRGRSKALDNVLERYLKEEARQQERRLQKEIDDRASQKR